MSASLSTLIAPLRPYAHALLNIAGAAGLQPRVTSTRRSHAEQARLYRRFLAGYQQYPVAPPGTSAHEYGYAFDMIISGMSPVDLSDLGQVWQGWGGVWGGAFKDPIHFEFPGFHPATTQQALHPDDVPDYIKAADFIASFGPLGAVQIADALVNVVDPVTKKYDRILHALIQDPFATLYRATR